jgi:hypothetical protein
MIQFKILFGSTLLELNTLGRWISLALLLREVLPFGKVCTKSSIFLSWEPSIQWEMAPQSGSGLTCGLGMPLCAPGLLGCFRFRPTLRGSLPRCLERAGGTSGLDDRLEEKNKRAG